MKQLIIVFLLTGLFSGFRTSGQDSAEKVVPRLDITYYKLSDDVPYLKVLVRKKVERRFIPMAGLLVKAYFIEESDENMMGSATTNAKGEGIIEIPTSLMKTWFDNDSFEFFASSAETDSTEAVSESLLITKAHIKLSATDDHMVNAVLEQKTADGWEGVGEVEMKFFVKRQFGKLPLTEDYLQTDEAGTLQLAFEGELPGDEQGNLTIGCMVEDHEEFGNIYQYVTTNWGTITVDDNSAFEERSLWATREKTPLWLLFFANIIIAGVWTVIIYLGIQIIKIRKLSGHH